MSEARKKLPEISVSTGPIVEQAKKMAGYRVQIAALQEKEDEANDRVKLAAIGIRESEAESKNFIGLIRIIPTDTPPLRCEFRIAKNSALDVSEEPKLDALFGAQRPLLFGREKVINEITDPSALIEELKLQGKNPWDYLDLKVKPGLDRAVADSKNVIAGEAFMPKKNFLETLNDIAGRLGTEALTYVKEYLSSVLSPVVAMTKVKG
jgi:hypothetical protein